MGGNRGQGKGGTASRACVIIGAATGKRYLLHLLVAVAERTRFEQGTRGSNVLSAGREKMADLLQQEKGKNYYVCFFGMTIAVDFRTIG